METFEKVRKNLRWLPAYAWQRAVRSSPPARPIHLIIALADHFEPAIVPGDGAERADCEEQSRRVERWCREYPKAFDPWRDNEGFAFRHTYFYPAEQYDKTLIDHLAEHCKRGWGEIEIHLHHGVSAPDTPANTRQQIIRFRDALAGHGCLSRIDGTSVPRYAFVHGNFALANSLHGRYCGVDDEMQILSETGCYADFTLPSAPNPAQVRKINSLYECSLPLNQRAPHRRGTDLQSGRPPRVFPLIIQGPLMLDFGRHKHGFFIPSIENSEISTAHPPSMERLRLWMRAGISVRGRADWIFVKLHCHGMDPRDDAAMLGAPMGDFLLQVTEGAKQGEFVVHFVTAREMANIILAACDGLGGDPGSYRDYRLRLARSSPAVT